MALAIHSNFGINATMAVSNMRTSQAAMGKGINHISSGKKAPRPADDIVTYTKGIDLQSEAKTALSKYNTTQQEGANLSINDSAYAAATDILLEMKGLAADYAEANTAGQAAAQGAFGELKKALLALNTSMATSGTSFWTMSSTAAGDALAGLTADLNLSAITAASAITTAADVDSALNNVIKSHTALGASMSALDKISDFLSDKASFTQAQYEAATEVDLAREMTAYVKNNIQTQAAQAMVAQANQGLAQTINLLQF